MANPLENPLIMMVRSFIPGILAMDMIGPYAARGKSHRKYKTDHALYELCDWLQFFVMIEPVGLFETASPESLFLV